MTPVMAPPMAETLHSSDWLLLALSAAGGRTLTPVQMQKVMFLLGKAMNPNEQEGFYVFRNHHYGAFCGDIYSDAARLAAEGLAIEMPVPGAQWSGYAVSVPGLHKAGELKGRAGRLAKHVQDLVAWALPLTFQQIVQAVYEKYPDTRENSVFRG